MADAYRTKGDVSIPRVIAVEGEGENQNAITESVTYPAGSFVLAENMTPRDRERAANGELDHLLDPADVNEARQAQVGPGEEDFGIFVPEHEAEAHALEVYGHTVVPPEQALEAASGGSQYAADYQRAVQEHGLDRRPVQEHLAQQRERVPDEVLTGGQTRTGLPFDRGPEGYADGPPESDDQQERAEQQRAGGRQAEAEVAAATRQRPGSQAPANEGTEGEAPATPSPASPQSGTQATPADNPNPQQQQ